jgi:diguanylate cyclase (GGDEF)-like protein/PAS domain S-box-containing protein
MYSGHSAYLELFLLGIVLFLLWGWRRTRQQLTVIQTADQPSANAAWEIQLATNRFTYSAGLSDIFGPEVSMDWPTAAARYVHSEDLPLLKLDMERHLDNGEPLRAEIRVRRQAQEGWLWVELVGQAVRDAAGTPCRWIGYIWDIDEKKKKELKLQESDERYRMIFQSMPVMIHMTDAQGAIQDVNPFWLKQMGYAREDVIGKPAIEFMEPTSRSYALEAICPKLHSDHMITDVEMGWLTSTGEVIDSLVDVRVALDEQGQILNGYTIIRDITERKRAEAQVANLAYHDSLTGLPNRVTFHDRLSFALIQADLYQSGVAVIMLDLDRFKIVNDSLGHQAGDQLLQHVGKILREHVRPIDTVARLGGDEFVLLLPGVTDADEVYPLAEALLEELKKPFELQGQEFYISASLGISLYPQDADNSDLLIQNADMAMYHAKEKGRNTAEVFSREMNARLGRRLQLESSMRKALERQEFQVFYQPQEDIATGKLFGMEALIRWFSAENGVVSPAEFIPIAEDNGLIVPIGYWMLRESCRQTKQWMEQGFEPLSVSVNISGKQFQQRDFVATVKDILVETGLDPKYLCLEITESTAIRDAEATRAVLEELIQFGIRFSIDDFGTGYSSLSLLKLFPLYAIKIDQSFVRSMTEVEEDAAVVHAIIAMSHGMKRKVIAEGVETKEQLDRLHEMGCDGYQGYYISRPVSREEFEQTFLRRST